LLLTNKLICINNTNKNLTLNKIYNILNYRDGDYYIENDEQEIKNYSITNFKILNLKEIRKLKINKIEK